MNNVEQGIIGCILMDAEYSMYQIYNKIHPDMFQWTFTKDCYQKCLALYDRGEEINIATLCTELEDRERSKEFCMQQLIDFSMGEVSSTSIKSYADTLCKEYRSREVKNLVDHIDLSPKAINDSIADILARLEELQENKSQKSKSLKQIADENKDKYFRDEVGVNGIKTGLDYLDDCLGNLEGGDITVIGARPSVGKSAIATQIIGNVAATGKKVGYFNLEMNEAQVYERFMARMSKISLTRIRRAKAFIGDESKEWEKANEKIADYNVIISTGGKSVSEIRAESRHQEYDLIVIDYLQLIRADRKFNNRASEVGEVSKKLKELAMELKVPIILLSQLNRVSEASETKEPTMAELRESGDIEQDASNIVLLWKLSSTLNQYKGLKVDKNRQGELIREGLEFVGENMEFNEIQNIVELKDKIKDLEKKYEYSSKEFVPMDSNPFDDGSMFV